MRAQQVAKKYEKISIFKIANHQITMIKLFYRFNKTVTELTWMLMLIAHMQLHAYITPIHAHSSSIRKFQEDKFQQSKNQLKATANRQQHQNKTNQSSSSNLPWTSSSGRSPASTHASSHPTLLQRTGRLRSGTAGRLFLLAQRPTSSSTRTRQRLRVEIKPNAG